MMPEWRVMSGEWRTLAQQREAALRLLYSLLGEESVVEHDGNGAPFFPDHPDLSVSISHCRSAVAVAVCHQGRVGIDVESRRKIGDGLMERVCTEDELASVCASDDITMAFLQLWTRKEAVLKMRGTGIQGFGSMVAALSGGDYKIQDLKTGMADVVASLATDV